MLRLKGLLALSAALIFAPLVAQAKMDFHHEVSLEGQTDNLMVVGLTHHNIKDTNFSGGLLVMHDTKHNNTSPGAGFRYNYQWEDTIPELYTTFGFATFVLDDDYQNTPNGQVRLGLDYVYKFSNNRSGLKFGLGVTKNFAGGDEAKDYGGYFSISWMSNNRHRD